MILRLSRTMPASNGLNKANFIFSTAHITLMKVLFICNQNQNRSKTAEELFKDRFETRSAGLYNDTPVTEKELEWADLIIVMEDMQQIELGRRFPGECLKKQIISLGIPDIFRHDQPELKDLLKFKINEILPSIHQTVA